MNPAYAAYTTWSEVPGVAPSAGYGASTGKVYGQLLSCSTSVSREVPPTKAIARTSSAATLRRGAVTGLAAPPTRQHLQTCPPTVTVPLQHRRRQRVRPHRGRGEGRTDSSRARGHDGRARRVLRRVARRARRSAVAEYRPGPGGPPRPRCGDPRLTRMRFRCQRFDPDRHDVSGFRCGEPSPRACQDGHERPGVAAGRVTVRCGIAASRRRSRGCR